MKMQHKALAAALTVALCGFACSAIAANPTYTGTGGTITISGTVVGQTCAISTNGGAANGSVSLPNALTTQLTNSGDVAGKTQFTIAISKCPVGTIASATPTFTNDSNVSAGTGNLVNTASSGATNVQVRLLNSSSAAIDLTDPTTFPSVTLDGSGDGSLTYYAEYYATAQSTSGAVTAIANFTMTYN